MKNWIQATLLTAGIISAGLLQAAELKLRIMETTDLRMNFLNYDCYLSYNGQPIDNAAFFIVATNNYRAFGGGNFPALGADKVILDAPEEHREALVEYLADASKTSGGKVNHSADNNWRILPLPGITMTFSSAAVAQKFLPNHKNIELMKDSAGGFATFALVP